MLITKKKVKTQTYCNCCYMNNIKTCDGCSIILELNTPIWCASDGKHFCNEDCRPDLNEALIIEEGVK